MQISSVSYLGLPDNLQLEEGTQFDSIRLQAMAAEAGITCRSVGIEGPNAVSVGERYHAPLRKTCLKLQESYGIVPLNTYVEPVLGPGQPPKNVRKTYQSVNADDEYELAIALMCIKATAGPEGFSTKLLAFGAMPKLQLPGSLPTSVPHALRMMVMENSMEEYMKIFGELRLKRAEKALVPKSPPYSLEHGCKVLVYRETSGSWELRYHVSRNEDGVIALKPNGDVQLFRIPKVRNYKVETFLLQPDLYGLIPDSLQLQECLVGIEKAPASISPELNVDIPAFLDGEGPTSDTSAMFDIVTGLPANFEDAI